MKIKSILCSAVICFLLAMFINPEAVFAVPSYVNSQASDCAESMLVTSSEEKIKLNVSKITLYVGQEYPLYLVQGDEILEYDIASMKNTAIANFEDEKIVAVKKGKTKISLIYDGIEYACNITVKKASILQDSAVIHKGKSLKLSVPKGMEVAKFSSSDTSVAKVSAKGNIKAIKEGKAVITIKCTNGKKYKCKITVSPYIYSAEELSKYVSIQLVVPHVGTLNSYADFKLTNNTPYMVEAIWGPYANGYLLLGKIMSTDHENIQCAPGGTTTFRRYRKEDFYMDKQSEGVMKIRINNKQYKAYFDCSGNTTFE